MKARLGHNRRTREQLGNKGISENYLLNASVTPLKTLAVWITVNWGQFFYVSPDLLTYHLRNVYEGQDTNIETRHGTIDQFKPGIGE